MKTIQKILLIALIALSIGQSRGQTTILSETFEGAFPGSWSVGDSNPSGTAAYWKDVNLNSFGTPSARTSYAGYCAGVGYGGTALHPTYQNSMTAYMSRTIDLTGYSSWNLSFWYIIPAIESGSFDKCRVYIDNDLIFERTVAVTSWTQKTTNFTAYVGGVHTLKFEFVSDTSNVAEGWYLDDILVTGTVAIPTVTVSAPTGGENWKAGTTHSITWGVSGSTVNVAYWKIALSTDGGATWPTAGTANDLTPNGIYDPSARSFSWTIGSSLNTAQARIRVRALASDSTILAENIEPANFTISPPGGTWTPLAQVAPNSIEQMLLLSDGTVMAASGYTSGGQYGKAWYRLTPNNQGSYVNGTWTSLSQMNDTRLWYSSAVLRDGRVFVAGGEYGTGGSTAEIYDPLTDHWTLLPNSGQEFEDSISKILANGNVLISPVNPSSYGGTVIYNPVLNSWVSGPQLYRGGRQAEASWVKLPDDSILTVDPDTTASERYIPSLNQWVNDASLPVSLYDVLPGYVGEIGAGILLPNGKAIFFGATGHTAIYTPSGSTAPGSWASGPDFPSGMVTADAPAAMMPNGKILCAAAAAPIVFNGSVVFPSTTSFFEYDYADGPIGSFTQVASPIGGLTDNVGNYQAVMLDLPDGTVLYSHFNNQLYVYTPTGSPLASGKPAINNITGNNDGSFHLAGTKLNGISEGAAYGDDAQMDSNYPLVRFTSGNNVYYGRTYNWSSTGVMTGNNTVTTEFTLPANLSAGTYSLVVVANGISSDTTSITLYAIGVSAGSGGTISPNSSVMKKGADNETFTAYPNANYVVNQWFVDGGAVQTGGTTYTLSNIQASHNVQVTFTYVPPKSDQTISFGALDNKAYGELPFTVSATASSGLPVSFSVLSGPITLSGNLVTITGTGTALIRASQSGNASYNPAPDVDQSFTVFLPPNMNLNQSGNTLTISWPTNVVGFVLESTPSLAPVVSWSPVAQSPVIVDGQYTVTINTGSGTMFFRLIK